MIHVNINTLNEKIHSGKTVYLINEFEEIAVKLQRDSFYILKPKGGDPYSVEFENLIVQDAILAGQTITEEEFKTY